jgi:hypothetical protein
LNFLQKIRKISIRREKCKTQSNPRTQMKFKSLIITISNMFEETRYVLRKPKFPTFARRAREIGYEVDSLAVRGLTDKQYSALCRQIDTAYRNLLETTFDVPLHDDNVEMGAGHIRQMQGYYVAHSAADFDNMMDLHAKKLLQSFSLRGYIVQDRSRFSKGMRSVAISMEGISLASDHADGGLHDPSKPQDYQLNVKEAWVRLQPKLLEVLINRQKITA